jgi:mono/diheme cytochrome c family protein
MRGWAGWLPGLAWLLLSGCDDMASQPKQAAYSPGVGPAATPRDIEEFRSRPLPVPPVNLTLLERGQERYRIDCTPCHSELGDGRGMAVQRGFPAPPSFHIDRLRDAPPQYFYDVMTLGRGAMYSFADRVQPLDRWAIAAYIRALQRSQNAPLADVAPDARRSMP